jgi:hypothetical protein
MPHIVHLFGSLSLVLVNDRSQVESPVVPRLLLTNPLLVKADSVACHFNADVWLLNIEFLEKVIVLRLG